MSADRHELLHRLFDEACALSGDARTDFLNTACDGDVELRQDLEALLRADLEGTDPSSVIAIGAGARQRVTDVISAAASGPALPEFIGRYRIRSVLGEGGMGVVYEAEQEDPHRRVALKVLRPGSMTPSLLRRFRYEAHVLGRLQHRGVAQIHEAGSDNGRSFFAMEYIDGVPIDRYVDEQNLDTRDRMELIAQVCDALHHAHQKGVIHRDLKPGNILVSGGQPKILDFGIARATDADIRAVTLQTDVGQLIGTLPYMSPEQARGASKKIDIRSDVYAIGVLAYEVLTGRLPYDLEAKELHEAVRTICDEEPDRLRSVHRMYRGDIETIVGKALEKDVERRYQSAAELAADIRRYLTDEAIIARPASSLYQLRKFARRNRILVFGVVATLFVSIAGTAVAAAYASMASANATRATETKDFLIEMISSIDPYEADGKDPTLLLGMLENAAERLESDIIGDELIEAELCATIGGAYYGLGRYEKAAEFLSRAHEIGRRQFGDDHPQTLATLSALGQTLKSMGSHDEAERCLEEALESQRRAFDDDHPNVLSTIANLGSLRSAQGRYAEAEELLEASITGRRRVLGDTHRLTLDSIRMMGSLMRSMDRLDEAEVFCRDALKGTEDLFGPDGVSTLKALEALSRVLRDQGRYVEAEAYARQVLERRRRILGDDHPQTLGSMNKVGLLLKSQGRLKEAEPFYRETLQRRRRVLDVDHSSTLISMNNLAVLLRDMGDLDGAESLQVEAVAGMRRSFGDDHPKTIVAIGSIANLYRERGELTKAIPLYHEAIERSSRVNGESQFDTTNIRVGLAKLLRANDDAAAALDQLEIVLRSDQENENLQPRHRASHMREHGQTLLVLHRYDEAEASLTAAHELMIDSRGETHEETVRIKDLLDELETVRSESRDRG